MGKCKYINNVKDDGYKAMENERTNERVVFNIFVDPLLN